MVSKQRAIIAISLAILLNVLLTYMALTNLGTHRSQTFPALILPYGFWTYYLIGEGFIMFLLMSIQFPLYVVLLEFAANRTRMGIRLAILHAIFGINAPMLYEAQRHT